MNAVDGNMNTLDLNANTLTFAGETGSPPKSEDKRLVLCA